MWQKLIELRDWGCTLIISTHAIDEAEALATRIGILMNGSLVEYGTITEIIAWNSVGYQIKIRLMPESKEIKEKFLEKFV